MNTDTRHYVYVNVYDNHSGIFHKKEYKQYDIQINNICDYIQK